MVYVERILEKTLSKYISSREILGIVGTRQCGKTTMLNHFLDNLKNKKIERISFENLKILEVFEKDIDLFIERYVRENDILFIDEVQYSKDSGKKLKYIYDSEKIKIIISGSSAPDLSIQSMKFLVGRILLFELYPFSFEEFLSYKDKILLKKIKEQKLSEIVIKEGNVYLEEFIRYGGYPRVVLERNYKNKKKILEGIYSTFLLREIREILDLSNDDKLIKLIKALSLQIGNLIDYTSLSRVSGFSVIEIKKYLNILQKTYILSEVKPFYNNKRTELVKTPKVYFYDLGFRNICIDNFGEERMDKGAMLENFVFSEIKKKNYGECKFWRTKSRAEVDFVLEKGVQIISIEIKTKIYNENLSASFRSFIEKYSPDKAFLFSLDFKHKRKFKQTKIYFEPFLSIVNLFVS